MTLSIVFHAPCVVFKSAIEKDLPFLRRALRETIAQLDLPKASFRVAIVLANDAIIQEMNTDFRGKNKPTNVLSFPQLDEFSSLDHLPQPIELGDIILAFETIKTEAQTQKKTLRDHTAHLMIHGLLHLFGHDHMNKKEATEMEEIELVVLKNLGIKNPYL